MKKPLFFFTLLIFSAPIFAQSLTKNVYEGTISGKIPIILTITHDGGSAFGNVVYKKKGIPITLLGVISGKTARLDELMNDGSITGIYSLKPTPNGWEGIWTAPTRDAKNQKVVLRLTSQTKVPAKPLPDLTGTYRYSYGEEAGTGDIRVVQIGPGRIQIAVNSVTGGPAYNMAIIERTELKLKGNQSLYVLKDEYYNCQLRFVFGPNAVQVDYVNEAYDCGFGNAATATGNYIRTNAEKPTFDEER